MSATPSRKGIILAGGSGTRLYPMTIPVSKQLLPVYDKPMIYYALSSLMAAGMRDVLVITTPDQNANFKALLGDGSDWGMHIAYAIQPRPEGLAQALIIAEDFLDGGASALILGDNIFYGANFCALCNAANAHHAGATIFASHVDDPERYGVVSFNDQGVATRIEEKPAKPQSSYAVTGLYFYDKNASAMARQIKPSARNELEITDLNRMYMAAGTLRVERMGPGYTWLDTGTIGSLMEAAQFVRTVQHRQGLVIGCPEEQAYINKWIDAKRIAALAVKYNKSYYGKYLNTLADGPGA